MSKNLLYLDKPLGNLNNIVWPMHCIRQLKWMGRFKICYNAFSIKSIQVEYVAGDTALQRMISHCRGYRMIARRRGLTVLWNPICFQFRQNIGTEYLIAKMNQSIHNIGLKWHSQNHLLPEAARLHIKPTRNARKVNKITDICHDQWNVW